VNRIQIADDPGVKIRAPWLGPQKGWRWPWDASYSSWALWGGASVVIWLLLHLAIPAGLVLGAAAYSLSRYVAPLLAPERTKLFRRGLTSTLLVLLALAVPYWRVWVFPMSFWVALVIAPALAVFAVRKWGKYVDSNRPIAYWLTVPVQAASGPRLDEEDEIDPARLGLGLDLKELSDERDYHISIDTIFGKAELTGKTRKRLAKVDPAEKRLVPVSKDQHSTKFIARTERGIRIGNTEFRAGA
jgi:hypothetical protein